MPNSGSRRRGTSSKIFNEPPEQPSRKANRHTLHAVASIPDHRMVPRSAFSGRADGTQGVPGRFEIRASGSGRESGRTDYSAGTVVVGGGTALPASPAGASQPTRVPRQKIPKQQTTKNLRINVALLLFGWQGVETLYFRPQESRPQWLARADNQATSQRDYCCTWANLLNSFDRRGRSFLFRPFRVRSIPFAVMKKGTGSARPCSFGLFTHYYLRCLSPFSSGHYCPGPSQ